MPEPTEAPPRATSSSGSPLTLRGQRTRAALVAAARVVFERDGFLNARITDISEEAGVAHGTFYTYFDSKEEVFRAVITALQDQLITERAEVAAESRPATVWEAALRANRRYLSTWQSNTALMKLWEEVATLDADVAAMLKESRMAFVARAELAIRALRDAGHIDNGIDPHVAAFALTGMVSRFAYVWFMQAESFDFDHVAEQLTRLWVNSIGVDPKTAR
jgi:AcrR family transcriptional regulator